MVGSAVIVPIKEDQIAGIGNIAFRFRIQISFFQCVDPVGTIGILWEVLHACVMQAEGNKHCAPVAVRDAVPRTVTGVALQIVIFVYNVISCAFGVAHLASCNSQYRLDIITGGFGPHCLPLLLGFQVCRRIGKAGQGVGVDRHFTDQSFFIASIGMFMVRCRFQGADQLLRRGEASFCVDMGRRGLFQAAAVMGNLGIAAVRVGVCLRFLQAAAVDRGEGVAIIPMGMGGSFLQAAHYGSDFRIASLAVGMRFRFLQLAAEHSFCDCAAFRMGMALGFRQSAGQKAFRDRLASFRVDMAFGFCQGAGQKTFRDRLASFRMGMAVIRRFCADQLRMGRVAFLGMYMAFAQQYLFVASFAMRMLLEAAKDLRFFGDGRKDQHVGGAEHDHAHHGAQNPLPGFSAVFPLQLYLNFKIKLLLHTDPSFPFIIGLSIS